ESSIIRQVVDRIFPFEATKEGLAYLETGRARGKVVIKVSYDRGLPNGSLRRRGLSATLPRGRSWRTSWRHRATSFLGGLMRWPFVTSALALVSAIAPAQIASPATTPGPVLLALGPARGRGGAGLHLRAEYYLTQ